MERSPGPRYEVFTAVVLAQAYGQSDRPERGLEVLASLDAMPDVRFYAAEVDRVRGELLLMRSPAATAEAHACLQRSLDLAALRQEKALELRAAVSLARALARGPRHREVRARLAAVYAGFTEGGDTADLRTARAQLEELDS